MFQMTEAVQYLEDHYTRPGQIHRKQGLYQVESAFTGGTGMTVRFEDRYDGDKVPALYACLEYSPDALGIPEMTTYDTDLYRRYRQESVQ